MIMVVNLQLRNAKTRNSSAKMASAYREVGTATAKAIVPMDRTRIQRSAVSNTINYVELV